MRAALAAALLGLLALPAGAQGAVQRAQAAFEQQDYATAAELWREAAQAGRPRAALGLGLLNDLGLGMPRDAAAALRWYLEAAAQGLPRAQFNVGVMLDAGTGIPQDRAAAAIWYARAAANGHRRAQYNLGLLYEAGLGVPQNHDLAAYWLEKASESVAAARERMALLPGTLPEDRGAEPPRIVTGAVVARGERVRAELVWSAPPGPEGARYRVVVEDAATGERVAVANTRGSAKRLELPSGASWRWRVGRSAGGGNRVWSPWQPLVQAAPAPTGQVTILVGTDDAAAQRIANEMSASFTAAGLAVSVRASDRTFARSSVLYRDEADAELAAQVAAFLPVLGGADIQHRANLSDKLGEIAVRIVTREEED